MKAHAFGSGAVVLAALIIGCAGESTGAFSPATVSSRAGATHPATTYDVQVGTQRVAQAKVWTEATEKPRIIDVGLDVRNETNAPLSVDVAHSGLEVTTRNAGTVSLPSPTRVGGSPTAAPSDRTVVKLGYALPDAIPANDVLGYRFEWQLTTNAGSVRKTTDFIRTVAGDRYGACPDYYGALGYCRGWDDNRWMGYDDPNDPTMPLTVPSPVSR
jgi:hypothetical protein